MSLTPSEIQRALDRTDIVPGVMHCAKCKFQLNRVTLSPQGAFAGDNNTEPCPNGCGPLWPVTWEQEARAGWASLEQAFNNGEKAGLRRAAEQCEKRACSIGPFHSAAARQCRADILAMIPKE